MLRSALLMVMLSASQVIAQADVPVALGDRVRVYAPKAGYYRITGKVIATTPDVISLVVGRLNSEIAVPRESITELLLSVGSNRHPIKGGIIGGALGVGFALRFGPREETFPGSNIQTGRGSTKNVVTGAAAGAALGALIGHFTQTDNWIRVSPRVR